MRRSTQAHHGEHCLWWPRGVNMRSTLSAVTFRSRRAYVLRRLRSNPFCAATMSKLSGCRRDPLFGAQCPGGIDVSVVIARDALPLVSPATSLLVRHIGRSLDVLGLAHSVKPGDDGNSWRASVRMHLRIRRLVHCLTGALLRFCADETVRWYTWEIAPRLGPR